MNESDSINEFPPLEAMAVFVNIVTAGSISEAARKLNISKSAISQRLSLLEEKLRLRLMERTKSGVKLTSAGEEFFIHCKDMLENASLAMTGLRESEAPQGILRVSSPQSIADPLLIPALGRFKKAYPRIRLDVIACDEILDHRRDKIDVGIRFGWISDGDFIAKELMRTKEILCASPEWLASNPITEPQHLQNATFIGYYDFGVKQTVQLLHEEGEKQSIELTCQMRTTSTVSMKFWAIEGSGFIRSPLFYAKPELDSGALVRVLPGWEITPHLTLYLTYLPNRYIPANIRRLTDFLWNEIKLGAAKP